MNEQERLKVGDYVHVDETRGLGRIQWDGMVTYNNAASPYITVSGVQVRKYEVTAIGLDHDEIQEGTSYDY